MADYSLTKAAAAVDATLNLIDEVTPKNSDSMLASAGVPLNSTVTRASVLHANLAASSTAYGDEGNGVTASQAATAIKNASDLLAGSVGETIYNTGNTAGFVFAKAGNPLNGETILGSTAVEESFTIKIGTDDPAARNAMFFFSPDGFAGNVQVTSQTTAYNTSSDNRLKTDLGKPTDEQVNAKFNDIYETFTLFDWKNGGNSEPVWGFFAHDVLDKGLDFASEGEGPRELEINDVYETIPAELDDKGKEIKPAIEKRVTPAGVDQSKVVPYLVAKIEQLERRINILENK